MIIVKRWAFWPLLALACMTAVSMIADPGRGSTTGTFVGLAASVPIAVLIDRRRQHRAIQR